MPQDDQSTNPIKTIFKAYAFGMSRVFDTREEAEQWIADKEVEAVRELARELANDLDI